MADYASAKHAIGICDRCGFEYKLKELRWEIYDQHRTGYRVCYECFDHEVLFHAVQIAASYSTIAFLNETYCTWPGKENENTVILMGLSDNESKKDSLKKMGMCDKVIEHQTVGFYEK